ncbi:helix-turn-helix domain-containing protein [Roseibium algae]|uniref:Helix-turn-helix transcriptional regulator n=1 Tax=Roseibium algae TaxID=3123038 RepID=A0ABU8TF29_9HYPH
MSGPDFTENLRLACTSRRSVSQVCREIGLNRQQFNRYINGETKPSAHNLARIAAYFDVQPSDFQLSPSQFRSCLEKPISLGSEADPLLAGFPGDIGALRKHLGYYQTYHLSLSWPGEVVRSCSRLEEKDQMVHVKTIERIRDKEAEIQQFTKYTGLASCLRNRIFIVERSPGDQPMIAQTILMPFGEHQRNYLKGVSLGVAWRKQNTPYSTPMIWRYAGSNPDMKQLLSRCGVVSPKSSSLPPVVRRFLFEETPNEQISSDPMLIV